MSGIRLTEVTLTCDSTGTEVDQFDADDNLIRSSRWEVDGSNGIATYGSDGSISCTNYDPDGSYRIVTNDGRDSIAMNDYAPDGSFSVYTNDGQGHMTMNGCAPDGSVSSYTDDGHGNIALNDYAPDGTPVGDAGVIADDNSGYYPDSNYAQDNSANQASNDNTNWNT